MNEISFPKVDEDKRRRVLDGATAVFLAYGYSRTTMDDIARAAEMSRPALYLLFRNKPDIYRALARDLFDQCAAAAEEALSGSGPFGARLGAMVDNGLIAHIEPIMASPHGAEILGVKDSLAADVAKDWRARMSALLAEAIAAEAAARSLDLAARGLSARTLADLFFDAMEGMKARLDDDIAGLRAQAQALITVVERVLAL